MIECPNCDSTNVRTEVVQERFMYGSGESAVELSCELPLRVCGDCRTQFMDEAGEMARHEAICRHLSLRTPAEIRLQRERFGSQVAFSTLTGIGEASLSRWETGASLQSKALDNYLFLLSFPENVRRLQYRVAGAETSEMGQLPRRFPNITITQSLLRDVRQFRLCAAA